LAVTGAVVVPVESPVVVAVRIERLSDARLLVLEHRSE
jgi:hypothetical protein